MTIITGVMIAGILLYFSGYHAGRYYFTIGKTKSSGYEMWRSFYEPMIFRSIDQNLYHYSQLNDEFWINVTLDSIDRSVWSKDGTMLCNFTRTDGKQFKAFVRWIPDYDIMPATGGKYNLKIRLTMDDSVGLNWMIGKSSVDERMSWVLTDSVISVRE